MKIINIKQIKVLLLALLLLVPSFIIYAESTADLIKLSGIKGGLVVQVINKNEPIQIDDNISKQYHIQYLTSDQKTIQSSREKLLNKGLHGRITVKYWQEAEMPYVNNLVNLLIINDSSSIPGDEFYRVLAPNGVILTKNAKNIKNSKLKVSKSANDKWIKIIKSWPPEIDEWTHWMHSYDNNAVSSDGLKEIPNGLQWVQSPRWLKSHELNPALSTMVSAQGRIFYIIDESAPGVAFMPDKWFLVARDAFNGIELWRHPIKEWGMKYWQKDDDPTEGGHRFSQPHQVLRRLVAVGDKVYYTPGIYSPVIAVDAANGKTIKTYKGTEKTFEIVCDGKNLVLAVNNALENKKAEPDISIMSVDVKSGKILWQSKGYKGLYASRNLLPQFVDTTLTIGKKVVFFADKHEVVGLDLKTGKKLWTVKRPESGEKLDLEKRWKYYYADLVTLAYKDSILLYSQKLEHKGKKVLLHAIDENSGKVIWEKTADSMAHYTPPDVFINQNLVWALDLKNGKFIGYNTKSGVEQKTIDASLIMKGTHHNCFRNKSVKNYILYGRNKGVEFFNLNTGEANRINWAKGACRYGIMPANGMIYFPSHNCTCFATAKLNGIVAVSPGIKKKIKPAESNHLIKGLDYDKSLSKSISHQKHDWPVYRHDNERTAYLSTSLPGQLKMKWKALPGGKLTPPVIANEKIYLVSKDTHTVHCLNEKDGKTLWTYITEGRIDSPPSYYKGRLVFGCTDGSVYCLNADLGKLIWQFKAAPDTLQMFAYDQIESAWPVFGSVLVSDDKVFCAAGRSTYVNSGIFLYMLDLYTGKPLKSNQLLPEKADDGEMINGVNADILVGNDSQLHIRGMVFDMKTLKMIGQGVGDQRVLKKYPKINFITALGGFLDESFFNGAFWAYNKITANMISIDDNNLYGINIYPKNLYKSHTHKNFTPEEGSCKLFASTRSFINFSKESESKTDGKKKKKKGESNQTTGSSKKLWAETIPIHAKSLIVGPDNLYLAGTLDKVDKQDPWGYLDGKMGGKLLVCSKKDGAIENEIDLESPPVFDGLAAANNQIFISCKDGSIICLEAK